MPVTFKVASHEANELIDDDGEQQEWTATRVVETVWHGDGVSCQEMLQSSFIPGQETYEPRANGFVSTVVRAYNNHHHLVLRPDDIWSAILNQFSFYVNANAEALRSKFVAHEGKRELEIIADGTRYTVNFGKMATDMGDLLQKNIVDQTLREWVIPNFTTTTPNDVVICSVMMMSTLKNITLLGEKDDYLSILFRLDKLEEFGQEPTAFAHFLRPVLKEFVNAFDIVDGTPNRNFWGTICDKHDTGSGPTFLSGWITAFCVWNPDGKWQGGRIENINKPVTSEEIKTLKKNPFGPPSPLVFGNMRYPVIDIQDVPKGFCQVDVRLDDNGELFDCLMIAGHVGMTISGATGVKDTLRPATEWFMFIKGEAKQERRYW